MNLKHNPETVVLLGMGPSLVDYMTDGLTQEFTPDFADEIWSINMTSNIYFSDIIFWMDDLEDQYDFKPGLFEVMKARERRGWPYKVITTKAYPNIVNSYDYPVNEIAKISIPVFGKPYLNNGVAMAIAYAMWKKVKVLKIYGADFTYPNRDFAESGRACVEAWATLATVRGMEIVVSKTTSLFDMVADHGVYGYKQQPEIEFEMEGRKVNFSYKPKAGAAGFGVYVAEDTRNELPGRIPGDQGSPAADAGDAGTSAQPIAPSALGTVERPRESVGDPDRHGRPEAGDHAGAAPGRAVRNLSDSGEARGVAEAGDGGPGQLPHAGPGDPGGDVPGAVPSVDAGKAKSKRRQTAKGA